MQWPKCNQMHGPKAQGQLERLRLHPVIRTRAQRVDGTEGLLLAIPPAVSLDAVNTVRVHSLDFATNPR